LPSPKSAWQSALDAYFGATDVCWARASLKLVSHSLERIIGSFLHCSKLLNTDASTFGSSQAVKLIKLALTINDIETELRTFILLSSSETMFLKKIGINSK